jgi:hypothetical protein
MQNFESFRNRLPFKVVPTNIPSVFALPPLSEDLDLNTVSTETLLKHGVHWCHPKESDQPAFRAAWKEVSSRRWHAKDCIVPHFEPQVGKTHDLRRAEKTETGYSGTQWSGGVIQQGQWPNVAGLWFIPTVSKPPEPPGQEGGWNSASWIGIDGFLISNDVLQAGVQQKVNNNGQASYVAWWEWFVPVPPGDPNQFPYINQTNITNFLVSPGDKIYCSVGYVRNNTAGQLYLANYTTGQFFSHIAAPPNGANFNASTIEWIMEAPDTGLPVSSLPRFTPVNFFQAFGWSTGVKGVGDPQTGDYVNINNGKLNLTSVALGSLSVTIDFIG